MIRKTILLLLTIFLFEWFYEWMPLFICNYAPFVFSLIGALVCSIIFFLGLTDFKSLRDAFPDDSLLRDWRHKLGWLIFPFTCILLFVFNMNFLSREESELKEYGKIVTGKVIDKSSFTLIGNGIYSVTFEFKGRQGIFEKVRESISKEAHSDFYIGQNIYIIYSVRNPHIMESITDKESIKTYTDSEERNLQASDLLWLFNAKEDEVLKFLNHIQYGWIFDENKSKWINERRHTEVFLKTNKQVVYTSYVSLFQSLKGKIVIPCSPPDQFDKSGFVIISTTNGRTVYESNELSITVLKTIEAEGLTNEIIINKRNGSE